MTVIPTSALALSRAGHDRASLRRTDAGWLEEAWPRSSAVLVLPDGRLAVEGRALVVLTGADAQELGLAAAPLPDRLLLGEEPDGTVWFAAVLPDEVPGFRFRSLRDVGDRLDDLQAGLATEAVALVQWHARNPYCARHGALTEPASAGWHRVCSVDGAESYPRTDPAVIMLVHDGADRCVLGRQTVWPAGRFSVLAGFVEAGEPIEAAVAREVEEEAGLTVTDVRYVASQPWPFPQSLMIGCTARATTTELRTLDHELAEVAWFTRDEVAQAGTWGDRPVGQEGPGVGPGGVLTGLPGRVSIARQLLDAWVRGDLPV